MHKEWMPPRFFPLLLNSTNPIACMNAYVGIVSVIFLSLLFLRKDPLISRPSISLIPAITFLTGLVISSLYFSLAIFAAADSILSLDGYIRGIIANSAIGFGLAVGCLAVNSFYALCCLIIIALPKMKNI